MAKKIFISKLDATILAAVIDADNLANEFDTKAMFYFTKAYAGSLKKKFRESSEDLRYDTALTAKDIMMGLYYKHEKMQTDIIESLYQDLRVTVTGWDKSKVDVTYKGDGQFMIHDYSILKEYGRRTAPVDTCVNKARLMDYLGFLNFFK